MSGLVVWFTGLPASGKTTLAKAVLAELDSRGKACCLLDSDEFRERVTPELGHDEADRNRFYRALAGAAGLLAAQGLVVCVAATAPRRSHRERARNVAPAFFLVHVATPLEVCEDRDAKGLYREAREGKIDSLPGVGAPYDPPEDADYVATRPSSDAIEIARRVAVIA